MGIQLKSFKNLILINLPYDWMRLHMVAAVRCITNNKIRALVIKMHNKPT